MQRFRTLALSALFLPAVGLFFVSHASAQTAPNPSITSYQAELTLDDRAHFFVDELFTYNGTELPNFLRTIPYQRPTSWLTSQNLRPTINEVAVDGTPFALRSSRANDMVAISLPNISGKPTEEHTFHAAYRFEHGALTSGDNAEFTWSTDLAAWKTATDEPTILVRMPKSIADTAQVSCFIVRPENMLIDCETRNRNGSTFTLKPGRSLQAGEEIAVMIRMPRTSLISLSAARRVLWFSEDNIVLVSPIFVAILCFFIWFFWGRDPGGRGRISPTYEPPQHFSPLEIGTMIDQHIDARDIAAVFVDWAVRGSIILREKNVSPLALEAIKKTSSEHLTDVDEQRLFSRLFAESDKLELSHTDSKTIAAVKDMVDDTYYKLVNKAYFVSHPAIVSGAFTAAGFATTLCGLLLAPLFGTPFVITLGFMALNGLIIVGTGYHMPRTTKNGALLLERIKGFKLFLAASETDQLSFSDAPKKLPEHFERFLPYAIAFGVEKQWAQQFMNTKIIPTWYESLGNTPLTTTALTEKLNVLTMNATSMMSKRLASKKK